MRALMTPGQFVNSSSSIRQFYRTSITCFKLLERCIVQWKWKRQGAVWGCIKFPSWGGSKAIKKGRNGKAKTSLPEHCCSYASHLWLTIWIPYTRRTLLRHQVSRTLPVSPSLTVRHLALVWQSLALPFQGWPWAQGLKGKAWCSVGLLEADCIWCICII